MQRAQRLVGHTISLHRSGGHLHGEQGGLPIVPILCARVCCGSMTRLCGCRIPIIQARPFSTRVAQINGIRDLHGALPLLLLSYSLSLSLSCPPSPPFILSPTPHETHKERLIINMVLIHTRLRKKSEKWGGGEGEGEALLIRGICLSAPSFNLS